MYSGKALCERHVHRIAGREDLLMDRFVAMMENDDFHNLRTSGKAKWTSEKQFCSADAQWWLGNDSQSFLASL